MRVILFRRILTVVAVLTVLFFGTFSPGSVGAAQSAQVGPGNALKVSPVRLDLKMDPGTAQTFSVFIQNLTSTQAILHPVVNDFVASGDESGRPSVILNENEYAPSHSLKRLVSPLKDLTVAAGETREVKVTITTKKDTAGGGYFGAVRFAPANAAGDKNVNLAASVGTLVLLRVNGDIKEDLTLESFDARKGTAGASTFFMNGNDLGGVARFKNNGNIHVEPFGTIRLKRFGKVLGSYEINNGEIRSSVLPDSVRRFDIKLDKVGSWGKYTLEGNFGYGSTGQLLTGNYTFYIVPVGLLAVIFGILLLLLFLIFVLPRMIRAYNRRVIRRANRRR